MAPCLSNEQALRTALRHTMQMQLFGLQRAPAAAMAGWRGSHPGAVGALILR